MGAIRPGSGGASALGDLSDIGTMGEPVAQADNITEVVTALGGASAVRLALGTASIAALTYDFTGGAHDYTADSNYAPSSSTSTIRANAESALLGDGVTVPKFHVFGRDFTAALARTVTPGLKVTMTAANGEQLLRSDSTTESGANLLIPLPWWAIVIPDWTLDVTVASIHSAQRQDRETITARCLKAVYNPYIDILGHPTGRLIGSRPVSIRTMFSHVSRRTSMTDSSE